MTVDRSLSHFWADYIAKTKSYKGEVDLPGVMFGLPETPQRLMNICVWAALRLSNTAISPRKRQKLMLVRSLIPGVLTDSGNHPIKLSMMTLGAGRDVACLRQFHGLRTVVTA